MNVLKEQMEIDIADHMGRCENIRKKMGNFLRNRHWFCCFYFKVFYEY